MAGVDGSVGSAGVADDDWAAVYVRTAKEEPGRIDPGTYATLQQNMRLAKTLGARVIELKSNDVAAALLKYARDNGVTHVIFGQSARTRWQILWKGSIINRFLSEVKDASVHVIPLEHKTRK